MESENFTFTSEELSLDETLTIPDVTTLEPATVTTDDLMFIYNMIKSVARGDWGSSEEQINQLVDAGFTDDQIEALLDAVDQRQ
jgi:hypothetical protein